MQLEDVALAALLPPPPVVRAVESEVSIEIVFEDDDLADAARTMQFVRFSAPYERIELSEVAPLPQRRVRPTTFAKTVAFGKGTPCTGVPSLRATVKMDAVKLEAVRELPLPPPSATVPFERVWFDEAELAEIEEPAVPPKASWWWLAISLAAGAAAVVSLALLA